MDGTAIESDRALGWRILACVAVAALPLGMIEWTWSIPVLTVLPWIGIAIVYGVCSIADQRGARYPKVFVSGTVLAFVVACVGYHWGWIIPNAEQRTQTPPSSWLLDVSIALLAIAMCALVSGARTRQKWLIDVANLLSLLTLLGPGLPLGEPFV
jgi:hypothetical protein